MLKSLVTTAVLASLFATAAPAQAGQHRQPINHETFDFHVVPGQYKKIRVFLRKSTHYSITAQHNPASVYPRIFPPPPDDVKLRVLRFWKGHKKMDRHETGLGSASMSLETTHHGDREYIIKVYNKSGSKKRFRLTVSRSR